MNIHNRIYYPLQILNKTFIPRTFVRDFFCNLAKRVKESYNRVNIMLPPPLFRLNKKSADKITVDFIYTFTYLNIRTKLISGR